MNERLYISQHSRRSNKNIYQPSQKGIKTIMIETVSTIPLTHIFTDQEYAWRLLQAQISMEMTPTVSGEQIAHLLQLYMKGVEKMNSISDQRESYFKNKVTSLMTKGVVIKSLKQNPMKKKNKPQQIIVPSNHLSNHHKKPQNHPKHPQKQQEPQHLSKHSQSQKVIPTISHIELRQKKKQFEMRIAYTAQQNNPDALKKLMLQQQCREQNLSKKINSIINNHEERLQERIKARKLKTATYRTHSQFNMNFESQTQPSSNKFNSNKKEDAYFFTQGPQNVENVKNAKEKGKNLIETSCSQNNKRAKSIQIKKIVESIKKKRKYSGKV